MKRFALVLALVVALAAGFGCAKKSAEPGYADTGISPEMQAAIQQITDGRVLFAFDQYTIQPQYQEVLKAKAELMKRYNTIRVRIGFAAPSGFYAYDDDGERTSVSLGLRIE